MEILKRNKNRSQKINFVFKMSTFIEIDEEWTEAQATRKYSSHKSWHTRYLKKIQGLYSLLDKAFDRVMEESLNENLMKCEGEVAILRQIADFMVQKKFTKAKDHLDEVQVLENEIEEWWETTTAAAHTWSVRAAAAVATPPAARRPPPPHGEASSNMKLVGELKPDNLQHDSTAGDLRVWRKKFESYYTASNMHLSRLSVQQAHLLNCLDRELSLQLDSSIQATTPVMGNGVTCLFILTGILKKKYPVLLRRNNFFSMAQ